MYEEECGKFCCMLHMTGVCRLREGGGGCWYLQNPQDSQLLKLWFHLYLALGNQPSK